MKRMLTLQTYEEDYIEFQRLKLSMGKQNSDLFHELISHFEKSYGLQMKSVQVDNIKTYLQYLNETCFENDLLVKHGSFYENSSVIIKAIGRNLCENESLSLKVNGAEVTKLEEMGTNKTTVILFFVKRVDGSIFKGLIPLKDIPITNEKRGYSVYRKNNNDIFIHVKFSDEYEICKLLSNSKIIPENIKGVLL